MTQSVAGFRSLMKQPGAFLPVTMSLAALTIVMIHVTRYGAAREADEGAVAHTFQLLIALQIPLIAYFAIRRLPGAPKETLCVLALQVAAVLAALAPVYYLHL